MEYGNPILGSNSNIPQDKLSLFKQHLQERAKWNIEIHPIKVVETMEFIESLDLDPQFMNLVRRKKSVIGDYIYFFGVELKDARARKSTLTWTLRRRYSDLRALLKELHEEIKNFPTKKKKPNLPQLPDSDSPVKRDGVTENTLMLNSLSAFLNFLIKEPFLREHSQALYDFLEISLLPLPNGPKKYKEGYMKKRTGGRYRENSWLIYFGVIFRRWLRRWFIINNEGILYTIDSNSTNVREMLLFDQSFKIEYGRKATGTKVGITIITPNRRLNLKAYDLFQAIDWILAIREAEKECPYIKINKYLSFAPERPPTAFCQWYVDAEHYFEDIYDNLIQAKREVFITDWWLSPELYLKRPVVENDKTHRLDTVLGEIAKKGVLVYIIVYREVKLALYNDSEYTKNALQRLSPNIRVLRHPNEFLFMWSHHEKLVVVDQSIAFLGGLDLCYGRMDMNSHPLHDPAFEAGQGETFPGIDFVNSRLADFKNVRDFQVSTISKTKIPRMPWHDIAISVTGEPARDLARHFIQYWNFAKIDLKPKKEDYFLTPTHHCKNPEKAKVKNSEDRTPNKKQGLRAMISETFLRTFHKDLKHKNSYHINDEKFDEYIDTKLHSGDEMNNEFHLAHEEKKPLINAPKEFDIIEERYGEEKDEESSNNRSQNVEREEEKIDFAQSSNKDSGSSPYLKADLGEKMLSASSMLFSDSKNQQNTVLNKKKSKNTNSIAHELYKKSEVGSIALETKMSRSVTLAHLAKTHQLAQEDKTFNGQYIDLMRKAREKESHLLEDQIKEKRSRSSLTFLKPGPVMKLKNDEPKEKLDDNFFEKNMLQLSVIKYRQISEGTCACQVVRSASHWSLGLNKEEGFLENSIQNAYIELIQNAKHFIYIENQFFISSTAGDVVKNEVVNAILLRIEKAHINNEAFKVIVFLPLLPGFEGEIDDAQSTVLRIQLHWEYQTICRGGKSLFEELERRKINPDDYIKFYSLRQHGKLSGVPVTEIIYIHSKLMIVDDDKAIIGSANINDRSMQGSRDSEIGIVVEDSKKTKILMGGAITLVGECTHDLRKQLYREHLNLSDEEVQDPLNEELLKKMDKIARRNTEIYRQVFACYPDDTVMKISEVKEFKKKKDLSKYDELAPEILGHIVQFPLNFLSDDVLTFAKTDKEYYLPHIGFT